MKTPLHTITLKVKEPLLEEGLKEYVAKINTILEKALQDISNIELDVEIDVETNDEQE